MAKTIGIVISERVELALVEGNTFVGEVRSFPEDADDVDALVERPLADLIELVCEQVRGLLGDATDIRAVGVAVPGLVRNGVVEEAPNLPQMKGAKLQDALCAALENCGLKVSVKILNDADAIAAGLAARLGKLDSIIRVWSLNTGIGYGRYPLVDGIWEGGHTVVTLDDKETYCGCGGRGHLEGIMGHRAMRMRFLDMEPEEVFEAADAGDERCYAFKRLWHKALAAATSSSIHMQGPGKFYITGYNARFVDVDLLKNYVQQMVKMSPLQSFSIEIVRENAGATVLGAGIVAAQSLT